MPLIAYIPARSGSKRIPLKNIKRLNGKPVLAHVIETLRRFSLVQTVCVSTDDERIARIARQAGAQTLERRQRKLSGDWAPFAELLKKDVPRYLRRFNFDPSETVVLFILATAALVTPELLQKAYREFRKQKADILVASRRYASSPFRALILKRGRWKPLDRRALVKRSQDLPEAQSDAGLFYFLRFKPMTRFKGHWFTSPRLICFPVPDKVAVDVDTLEDWKELEHKFKAARK